MTVLIDTGVLYADHDTDATRHESARTALAAVYDGRYGQPLVSKYVFDELLTLTVSRTDSIEAATRIGDRVLGRGEFPNVFELVEVTDPEFFEAVDVFGRYSDQNLSFTDATLVAQADRNDVDAVLSFDDDFDGLVDRIAPEQV
jgi:predicted nucleic acid-binding protein